MKQLHYIAVLSSVLLFCQSSKKDVLVIDVSNTDQLYEAVYRKTNEKIVIRLHYGIYKLEAQKGPKAGRIEFQRDMEIHGLSAYGGFKLGGFKPVIDGSELPAASFNPGVPRRTGFIRMGDGSNTLTNVHIIGNTKTDATNVITALSAIDIDLKSTRAQKFGNSPSNPVRFVSDITITNTTIVKGVTGINIRNVGPDLSFRTINAKISNNNISEMTSSGGQGITIQNAMKTTGGIINVHLKNNRLHGNNVGLRIMNINVSGATIKVDSENDWINTNKWNGILLFGGNVIRGTPDQQSANNMITFSGKNTQLKNNNVPPFSTPLGFETEEGSIFVVGGYSVESPASLQNDKNIVTLVLHNPIFASGVNHDINIYGASSSAGQPSAGMGNKVSYHVQGATGVRVKLEPMNKPADLPGIALPNLIEEF